MKVFEVTYEYSIDVSNEIITQRQFVTTEKNTLQSVVNYFTIWCEQYEKELKGVREVLTISQNITT